uniref:Uncharacterized protein n=1 Tax=Rhizophora mucronata TaxID=61149 RepID=A0A2P2J4U5_RHIMU
MSYHPRYIYSIICGLIVHGIYVSQDQFYTSFTCLNFLFWSHIWY